MKIVFFSLVVLSVGQTQGQDAINDAVRPMIVQANQGSGPWQIATDVALHERNQLPIGLFDSGIGGLTVLEAILGLDAFHNETLQPGADGRLDFEGERFIYFGDQANMPYGNYASAGKQEFLRELILKDAVFLLGRRYWRTSIATEPSLDKLPVKAIAIGCNTATAYGLQDIRQAIAYWKLPVPVIGVVEAGARGLLEQDANHAKTIAVLATVGTCNTGAYPKTIASTLGMAGKQVPTVIQQGFAELAAAIEGDANYLAKGSVRDYIHRDVRTLVEDYKRSGGEKPIGYVVLGCTHFPLVREEFLTAFSDLKKETDRGQTPYVDLISDKIEIINPAELTAKELFRTLARERLRVVSQVEDKPSGGHRFFMSVPNVSSPGVQVASDGGFTPEYKYGRDVGQFDREDYRIVPLTKGILPGTSKGLIESRLPRVWTAIEE